MPPGPRRGEGVDQSMYKIEFEPLFIPYTFVLLDPLICLEYSKEVLDMR